MLLSLTGCSSAGGISTFTAAVDRIPSNFDPQIASSPQELLVINNIFDGLFEIQNGNVVNSIAEKCDISSDGKTYTIAIRQDNLFRCRGKMKADYDGTGVKAADFVFAIQRVLDPKTHSPYAEDFSNIKTITAVDEYTLKIVLYNADFNFTEKLAMSAAFPCNEEFFRKTGGAYGLTLDNILSNGPFRLNYLDTENGNATIIRVTEADGYVERIRITEADSEAQAVKYAEDSISGYFSHSSQKTTHENSSQLSFDSGNIGLMFNMERKEFSNENIRKALGWYAFGFKNSGANMAAVDSCQTIFPGTVTVAGNYINDIITPQTPSYLNSDPKSLFQSGLNELGISRLDTATILMPSDSIYTLIYENINQLWQKNLAQFFSIEYLPTSQIKQRVEKGDFDLAFLPISPANNTPYGILDQFTKFSSTLSELVTTARMMPDQKNAVQNIAAAQNLILERAMAVPMGSEQTVFYYRSYFSNIYVDPFTGVINLKHTKVS